MASSKETQVIRSAISNILLVLFVLIVSYVVFNLFLEPELVRVAVLLVFFNIYMMYRSRIRRSMRERDRKTVDQYLQSYGVETTQEEEYKDFIVRMDEKYTTCPKCKSKNIPGLSYCEECGYQSE